MFSRSVSGVEGACPPGGLWPWRVCECVQKSVHVCVRARACVSTSVSPGALLVTAGARFPVREVGVRVVMMNCGVGEDSGKSPGLQGDPTSPSGRFFTC